MRIKWFTSDSEDGERSLKQHAVIDISESNRMLCNKKSFLSDDGSHPMLFKYVEGESLDIKNVCVKCLKKYHKLKNEINS